MYTSIVTIYEYVIICMYVCQETVQFTSIKYMCVLFCSILANDLKEKIFFRKMFIVTDLVSLTVDKT